jgi:hypothetical protein
MEKGPKVIGEEFYATHEEAEKNCRKAIDISLDQPG